MGAPALARSPAVFRSGMGGGGGAGGLAATAQDTLAVRMEDNNKNKNIGARIGVVPIRRLEVGGSGFLGKYDDAGILKYTGAGGDIRWHHDYYDILGEVLGTWRPLSKDERDFLARETHEKQEEAGVDMDTREATEDAIKSGVRDKKLGIYMQGSLRPGFLPTPFLKDLELILRFGLLREVHSWGAGAGAGTRVDVRRQITPGLNYPIADSVFLKVAYDVNFESPDIPNNNAFRTQIAVGF